MAHAILKLVSGESIIADVTTSSKQNYINVTDPLILRTGIDDDNRMVISMYKWVETAQTTFTIENSHIILRAAPTESIIDYYNEVLEDDKDFFEDEEFEELSFEKNYSSSVH
jgi:hypothetical protein